ncbi:transcriptional regulator [Xylophilus rhododendri]|uniref:Transcriptional regulator n=2 Tax=Xylophilus rhododendri TaxID=2697032 RepID=A0A857JFI2_9BURK|nr:transcriptional regulator [Xylophilus rhododendri]
MAFHESSGLGRPIQTEDQYETLLAVAAELMDALVQDDAGPLGGLVELVAKRIQAYEARVHPWPNGATPAQVLEFLMDQHGLKQGDLPEIGSQGVVSEILRGKRDLNVRQIARLAERFHVSPASFFPEASAAHLEAA